MFTRLRRTVQILTSPVDRPEFRGVSRVAEKSEVERERERASGVHAPTSNPAIRIIEGALILGISLFIIQPLAYLVFSPAEKQSAAIVGVSALVLYSLWEHVMRTVQGSISNLIRLDFLDPYVGRRLQRTWKALRS